MANNKEKIFVLHYKTNEPEKLHKFINDDSSKGENKRYIYWAKFLPNFYALSTLENTYWNVNKLSDAIYKYMNKNIQFVVFEVQNSPAQGRMDPDFWKFWKDSQDLTGTLKNRQRAGKLKKIQDYIKKKEELSRKEIELKKREIELKKALSLKKKEDEIRQREMELKKLEEELNPVVEEPQKKKKWKLFR